ncbi:MAG: ABC transporter substrate binding protein, partial [Spirochaetaceae bacterium]|nr:ABC transporter substrate binding protein [Spirochaetaceae bacterium]
MKKFIITFLVIVALTFSLFANGTVEDKPLTIGITKIVAHPALDALENGIMEVVLESYPDARFDNQNANGEMSTASTIAQKFKADKVDLAVGIATPTAVALANTIS